MSDFDINQFKIELEPFYEAQSNETELYTAAYNARLPVMVKGPTGCGKSRFIEHMAYKLDKPIITVSCNEDITASDLIGRYLLDANGTRWVDGPLTLAARHGAICYLDEIVEARQDTMVVIHSLTDHRRELMLDKKGELVKAHAGVDVKDACHMALVCPITDDAEVRTTMGGAIDAIFG